MHSGKARHPLSWAMIVKTHSSEIDDIYVAVQRAVSIHTIPLKSHQVSVRQRMATCSETSYEQNWQNNIVFSDRFSIKLVPLNASARVQCNIRITFSEASACLCMTEWLKVTELLAVFINETKPDRITVICMCSFTSLSGQCFCSSKNCFYIKKIALLFQFPFRDLQFSLRLQPHKRCQLDFIKLFDPTAPFFPQIGQ